MKIIEGLRGATDLVVLAAAARNAEKYQNKDTYGPLAQSLANQVLKGSCDPVVAEAALSDHSAVESEDFVDTAKAERGAKALERLVLNGNLDPLFAEQVLDRGFSKWSVRDALEQVNATEK